MRLSRRLPVPVVPHLPLVFHLAGAAIARKSALGLTALVAALALLLPSGAYGQHNPNGWIQTSGWNLLFPLLNADGCSGGGPAKMKTNWIAPFEIGDPNFNPRGGEDHDIAYEYIDLGRAARAAGWDSDPYTVPVWDTLETLEHGFFLSHLGPFPNGDVVDFQGLVDQINTGVESGYPGAPLSSDNVLGLATTYVENPRPYPLRVGICTASDDSIQVWVNDVLVTNASACRSLAEGCEETLLAVLPPGVSKIAVLVWQGSGGWGFRLGIKEGSVGPNLDDDGVLVFLGPGEQGDSLSGQAQYRVRRTLSRRPFNLPTPSTTVTLRGQGPGNPDDVLVVEESVFGAVEWTDISPLPEDDDGSIRWVVTRGQLSDPGLTYTIRPTVTRLQAPFFGTVFRSDGDNGESFTEAFIEGEKTIVLDTSVATDLGPAGLTAHDIGLPPMPGSTRFEGGEYILEASGADIWDEGDQFHFAYKEATGDFEAIARITARIDPPTDGRWGKHGLMARYSCDANAKYSMVHTSLDSRAEGPDEPGYAFRVNHLENGPNRDDYIVDDGTFPTEGRLPTWMRLVRRGNAIYGYLSESDPDDPSRPKKWRLVGSDTDPRRPGMLLVGMALTAHTGRTGVTGGIRFDSFSLVDRLEREELPECTQGEALLGPLDFSRAADVPSVVQGGGDFRPGVTAGGKLRLTEDGVEDSAVAVWLGKISTAAGFIAEFDVNMVKAGTCRNLQAADGMTFAVVQAGDGPDALGTDLDVETLVGEGGRFLGYGGGELRARAEGHPSFAVELDTWFGTGDAHTNQGSIDTTFGCGWHLGVDVNGSVASVETTADFRVGEAIAVNFAADEPDPADPGNSSRVDGPAGYFGTAVWNNLEGPVGGPEPLVNAVGSPTAATITWNSNNTWASTGRGEENNIAPPGDDRNLMTGYLDTTDTSETTVTVEGLEGLYAVYVYVKGGTNARGGEYASIWTQKSHTDTAPFDGTYRFGARTYDSEWRPKGYEGDIVRGSFVRIAGGEPLTLVARPTTGTPPRAPINGLEIVPLGGPSYRLPHLYAQGVRVKVVYRFTGLVDVFVAGRNPDGNLEDPIRVLSTPIPPLEGPLVLGFTAATGAATVTQEIDNFVVYSCLPPGGTQRPGDCNQDGSVDLSDAICVFGFLFLGSPSRLPCGEGLAADQSNLALLDWQPDGQIDLSDGVSLLRFLFLGGPAHPATPGLESPCLPIVDCPDVLGSCSH